MMIDRRAKNGRDNNAETCYKYEPGKIRSIRIVSSNSTLFEKVELGSAGVIYTSIVPKNYLDSQMRSQQVKLAGDKNGNHKYFKTVLLEQILWLAGFHYVQESTDPFAE
jgi:hypothetical protein